MHKEKTTSVKPDFILYDLGIQTKFAKMCQEFKKSTQPENHSPQDWVIIDNETGEVITPQKNHT